jgi:hypothetical protein
MVLLEFILGSKGLSRFTRCRADAPESFHMKRLWSCCWLVKQILADSTVAGSRLRVTELYGFAELLESKGIVTGTYDRGASLWVRSRITFRSLCNSVAWLFIRKFSTVPATDTFFVVAHLRRGRASILIIPITHRGYQGQYLAFDQYRLVAPNELRRSDLEARWSNPLGLRRHECAQSFVY